jgi:hypothetical protein
MYPHFAIHGPCLSDNPGIGAKPFYLGMVAARFGTALGFDFRARR